MTLALATVGLLLLVGLDAVTWIFLAITTIVTIIMRLLYHGGPAAESNQVRHYEHTV